MQDTSSFTQLEYAELVGALTLPVKMLLDEYPPIFGDKRKRTFFEQEQASHKSDSGKILLSRWCYKHSKTLALSSLKKSKLKIVIDEDKHYRYTDKITNDRNVWWMNFTSFLLFGLYGSDLFSQDKVQVMEHPLMGSVTEFLDESDIFGMEPETSVETNIKPLPFLLENVPQWFDVNGYVNVNGEKHSIYSENFCESPMELLNKAIVPTKNTERHNFIAAAAPCDGKGQYTEQELLYAVQVALCAFSSAKQMDALHGKKTTAIHTGNWGCGSFHNNYELIYVCQLLAAMISGVDEVIFHHPHQEEFEAAKKTVEKIAELGDDSTLEDIVDYLDENAYFWAVK